MNSELNLVLVAAYMTICQLCAFASLELARHFVVLYHVHIDFAELNGKYFFLLTDAHSKRVEVFHMASTTKATATSQVLRGISDTHRLPCHYT